MKGGFEFQTLVNTEQIYVKVHHAKAISKSLDYYINHFGITQKELTKMLGKSSDDYCFFCTLVNKLCWIDLTKSSDELSKLFC
jgi:hypothetical protein